MSEQASREDIESLGEKMDAFAATLSDGERDILAQVLENASENAEVEAFARHGSYGTSSAGMMALTLGPRLSVMRNISASYFGIGGASTLPKE